MGQGELIEANAGLCREHDLHGGAIGAAECHQFFGDLLAERSAFGLATARAALRMSDSAGAIACGHQRI
jgi:hypothetical protein